MILLKNIAVYQPAFSGINDVLVGGEKIVAIEKSIDISSLKNLNITVIDGTGKRLIPGLIDGHAHIAGAGGEGGPATRTPEMQLSHMIDGGITSIVGCLGTDGFTRSLQSVLMKVKGLKQEGVSAFMYTGAYQVPTPTMMGDVAKDIAAQISGGSRQVFGVMVESHLVDGAQKFTPGKDDVTKLAYGQSITDACIGWDDSEGVLQVLSDAVKARRSR